MISNWKIHIEIEITLKFYCSDLVLCLHLFEFHLSFFVKITRESIDKEYIEMTLRYQYG